MNIIIYNHIFVSNLIHLLKMILDNILNQYIHYILLFLEVKEHICNLFLQKYQVHVYLVLEQFVYDLN